MELVRYQNAKNAIAEYKTVDEVKTFRDKAVAIQAYAKQANDYDLERDAAIARVRAERKCGELLRDMAKAKGNQGNISSVTGGSDTRPPAYTKTLSEMGVTKDQSSKWQKLAEVPEDVFETVIGDQGMKVSGNQILETANPKEPSKKIDVAALWVWGRLRDMERDNLFQTPLKHLLDEMTDGMKPDAERIIPKLKEWINNYE